MYTCVHVYACAAASVDIRRCHGGLAEVSPLPPTHGSQLILEVKLPTVDRLWSSSEAESRNLERYWPEKMLDKYHLWVKED